MKNKAGFTLLEVLISLVILAISLVALFKTSANSINQTQIIKTKTLSHLVMLQALNQIQLGLELVNQKNKKNKILLFGKIWHWQAEFQSTPIKYMQKVTLKVILDTGNQNFIGYIFKYFT